MGDDVKAALREALTVLEDRELSMVSGTRSGLLKNSRTPMEMISVLPPGSSRMDGCPASPEIPEEKESTEAFSAGLLRVHLPERKVHDLRRWSACHDWQLSTSTLQLVSAVFLLSFIPRRQHQELLGVATTQKLIP
jgi:hypothetical protein